MRSNIVHCNPLGNNAPQAYAERAVAPPQVPSTDVHAVLERALIDSRMPAPMDDGATLSRMSVIGNQLLLTAQFNDGTGKFSDSDRSRGENALCNFPGFLALLHYGASIRSVYVDQRGREIGAAMVTKQECGF
jgi:hypothetical protein